MFLILPAHAQILGKYVANIAQENAGYVQPLANAFGANLNSGLYHTADVHDLLGIDVGVRVMFAIIPSRSLTYPGVPPQKMPSPYGLPDTVPTGYPSSAITATIFGTKGATVNSSGYPYSPAVPEFTFPDGLDMSTLALAVPQASIGFPFGTELLLRYIPPVRLNSSVGDVTFYGAGIKHSLSQYIPLIPLDIAAQAAYQRFTLQDSTGGPLLTANAFAFSLIASKTITLLTLYGGIGYERSDMTITYTYVTSPPLPPQRIPLKYNFTGENKFRWTVGVTARLLIASASIDYTFANQPVVTLGASFTLR